MPPSAYPLWITGRYIDMADQLKTNEQGRIVGVTTFPSATHLVGLPDPDAAGEAGLLPLVRSLVWGSTATLKGVKAALPAEAVMPACPDAQEVDEWVLRGLAQAVQGGWGGAHWHLAPDAWREANWPRAASTVAKALGGYGNRGADLPARAGASGLRVLPGYEINPTWGVSPDTLFPPTEAGWAEFLERAKESGLKWGELDRAASWWWRRRMPRG